MRNSKPRPRTTKSTRNKRDRVRKRFLERYRETGNITDASEFAGCDRGSVYSWCGSDPEFKASMDAALDAYVDTMEREADRRAIQGVDQPVFQNGREVGVVRKYSDVLLMFRLNGQRPEKYKRWERHEHTGKDGGPIKTQEIDVSKLSTDKLRQLDEILAGAEVDPKP